MQTPEELEALRKMGPPPGEIKFKMKNGEQVIVRTNKLPGSPNYTYTASVESNGVQTIILHTMSCPGHDDIVQAHTAYKTSRKE